MAGAERRKLVLVVDDDSAVRTLIATALAAKGYESRQAANGLAASELLGTMPRAPDLIICDVMMPVVDGFSFIKVLKTSADLHSVPVIFLTAKTAPNDVVHGIQLGARHYVQKPFSIKDLLDKVDRALK
jgi:DNA-binding response OmpR family regulator